ncbi:MAG TPA: type II toxin-antitoxin system VapC family toxin [Pyrinomonadaceae bacterium]|nr:type II toxin-antitoxin system VapC family toxin [Pyrinomonadaceae bacterium]
MKLLLDTHAFVWIHEAPSKISPIALASLSNPSNQLSLSIVSIWELQIKIQAGKFRFKETLEEVIEIEQTTNGLQILPVTLAHVLKLENLPLHHKDPFDRLLISQAIVEDMTLVSADANFANYQVNLLW